MDNELTPALHQLPPGVMLRGRYRLGQVLGEGGFGITYEGHDTELELKVAVKEYYPSGFATREVTSSTTVQPFTGQQGDYYEKGLHGFIGEARRLAKLSSLPGIAAVRDFFRENGTAYIVMEFIDGQTFKQYLQAMGGRLLPLQVFEMMTPVMQSLAEIHRAGLIHRDISPDNIMISHSGYMKLLDFGAARDFTESGNKSLSVLLKPGFAPIEQYSSRGRQGPWTDIYALCATMYRAITGTMPGESVERLQHDDLEPPSRLGIAMPPAQEAALLKGMAVLPENRWQDMPALMAAIEPGYGTATVAHVPAPVPAPEPAPRPQKEKKLFVWPLSKKLTAILAGVVVVVIAVCVGVPVLINSRKDPGQAVNATTQGAQGESQTSTEASMTTDSRVYVENQAYTYIHPDFNVNGEDVVPKFVGTYTGYMVNGKPEGANGKFIGSFVFNSENTYHFTWEGDWKNGYPHGKVKETFIHNEIKRTKETYEGSFKNGKYDGQGTNITSERKYIGEWKDGRENGQGTCYYASFSEPYSFSDDKKYVGEWKDGWRHGHGTMYGDFVQRNEAGYRYTSDGVYVGQWKNGSEDGQGTFKSYDGQYNYEGQFKDGKFVG